VDDAAGGRDADPWDELLAAARPAGAHLAQRAQDPAADALFELYAPLLRHAPAPLIVGHLGQSLDGFIATDSGDSRFVTGRENILHLHRMRALFDAVIVGAGTVAADDPQLTTREVRGPNPLRVVLDPQRRLGATQRLFTDGAAPTWLVCQRSARPNAAAPRGPGVEVLELDDRDGEFDLPALVALLQARGLSRLFVEGGGRTVSSFLRAGLLTRLQVTVAPLLIGAGRPSMRLPGSATLAECLRAPHRIYRMGPDLMVELDLAAARSGAASRDLADARADCSGLVRII
jgi:riboflavin-specific deaminase-like protein